MTGILSVGSLLSLRVGKRMRAAFREARRRRSSIAANMNEKIASLAVMQVFGQTERERQRLSRQSQRLQESMVERARTIGLMRAVTEQTSGFASMVVLLLGAEEVAAGRVTPGTVVGAMTIVHLLVPALRDLGRVFEYWQGAQVATTKLQEFLAAPSFATDDVSAPDLQPQGGQLAFANVHLNGVLQGVTATIRPGTVVAIVGPNGAGKSTLLSLAARLLNPDSGTVLLDGQDLAQYSLASVRRAIGMVSPDLPLLRGTVDKNLRYRWPDAPEEEFSRVMQLCQVDEVLAELPQGAQTRLTEGGTNISVGQRQRIALARALLGNPAVLLLDEADANLDHHASTVLDHILADYPGTVLLVTHQPERLATADVIWHLNNGQLVEISPPRTPGLLDTLVTDELQTQVTGTAA